MPIVGGQWLLAILPFWATVLWVFFFGTALGLIYILASLKFKIAVNVSFSGQVGDLFLAGIILIGATVLKRIMAGSSMAPHWCLSWWWQAVWFGVAALAAWASLRLRGNPYYSPHLPDRYHNIVIAGIYFYFLPALVPVMWYAATAAEWYAAVGSAAIWAICGIYDLATGRIDQPKWLREHGFDIMPQRR